MSAADGQRPVGRPIGRPPVFTEDQVRTLRAEYAERLAVLSRTRSVEQMARDTGASTNTVWTMLKGFTYKRVDRSG